MILLSIISFIFTGIFFIKKILFSDLSSGSEFYVLTESLDKSFSDELKENDIIYDTLTKRKVGTAESVQILYADEQIQILMFVNADFIPKSNALRTKNLWFKYITVTKDEYQNLYTDLVK